MFIVEIKNATNTQLHSQARKETSRAWQLQNIIRKGDVVWETKY